MTIGDAGITLQRFVYEPNPGALSVEDKDLMCERVWKQVFGNAYVYPYIYIPVSIHMGVGIFLTSATP